MELLDLPEEILERIITESDERTLFICAHVNEKFRAIAQFAHKVKYSKCQYTVFLSRWSKDKTFIKVVNAHHIKCTILYLLPYLRIFGQNIEHLRFQAHPLSRLNSQLFYHQIGNYLNEYCINLKHLDLWHFPLFFVPWTIPKHVEHLDYYFGDLGSIIIPANNRIKHINIERCEVDSSRLNELNQFPSLSFNMNTISEYDVFEFLIKRYIKLLLSYTIENDKRIRLFAKTNYFNKINAYGLDSKVESIIDMFSQFFYYNLIVILDLNTSTSDLYVFNVNYSLHLFLNDFDKNSRLLYYCNDFTSMNLFFILTNFSSIPIILASNLCSFSFFSFINDIYYITNKIQEYSDLWELHYSENLNDYRNCKWVDDFIIKHNISDVGVLVKVFIIKKTNN